MSGPGEDGMGEASGGVPPTRIPSFLGEAGGTVSDSSRDETAVTPASGPSLVDPGASVSLERLPFEARYVQRTTLGKGGMGEVRLCRDHLIGREVALKVVRPGTGSQPGMVPRFIREARIQGQLEHPAIVPVYDLGLDPEGSVYFTMKRVRGRTLADVIESLRRGDPDTVRGFSRRKQLTAFSSVCLAVDFVHRRGVIHRDLKPANVMLGDFGEVYVLDWGLARTAGAAEPEEGITPVPGETEIRTAHGALLGTPGYMAPEQVRGERERIDARADVYALGCILFEILALEPLHGRGSAPDLIASTLTGADARPSRRSPQADIPPELDAICARATALLPQDRYASARELHDALERYLDGDRDLELRRQLAAGHAEAAAEAAVLARAEGEQAREARRRALREVGRALALDPHNERALRTLVRLMTEPPREIPPEARAEIEASAHAQVRAAARVGGVGGVVVLLFIPLVLWMGVHDWEWMALLVSLAVAAAGLNLFQAMRPAPSALVQYVLLAVTMLATVATARILGPFVLLPTLALANTLGFVASPDRRGRVVFIVTGCLATLVPALLEWVDLWRPSYVFHDGRMTVLPQMLAFEETSAMVFLILVNLFLIIGWSLAIGRIRDALDRAEKKLHLQAWQLRQLIPGDAVGAPAAARKGGA
jgi:serine/threonine-protein kinase